MLDLSTNARKTIFASPLALSSAAPIAVSVIVVFLRELLRIEAWFICGAVPKFLFFASSAESWQRMEVCNASCVVGGNWKSDLVLLFLEIFLPAGWLCLIRLAGWQVMTAILFFCIFCFLIDVK